MSVEDLESPDDDDLQTDHDDEAFPSDGVLLCPSFEDDIKELYAKLNAKYCFSDDLAEVIQAQWESLVQFDPNRPDLPPPAALQTLLRACYIASLEAEESRPVVFNVSCLPSGRRPRRQHSREKVDFVRFESTRGFTPHELRRLSAATNTSYSTIWASFSSTSTDGALSILGLINLGRSWSAARRAEIYSYSPPIRALNLSVLGPGRIDAYQGQYLVARLASGKIIEPELSLFSFYDLDRFLHSGIASCRPKVLFPDLCRPQHEPPGSFFSFEHAAYINVLQSLVLEIQRKRHGGTLVVAQDTSSAMEGLNIKYRLGVSCSLLSDSFGEFMATRNRMIDIVHASEERDDRVASDAARWATQQALTRLSESVSFVADLANVDGALIITQSLKVLGFGAEILTENVPQMPVYRATGPFEDGATEVRVEDFGMRHRSAIKLCARSSGVVVFVVSQDGEISLCWSRDGQVRIRRGISLVNANMAF